MPRLVPEDVAAPLPLGRRPRLDQRDRLAEDPLLDRLPLAVQVLELGGEPLGLVRVVGEEELERHVGSPEPAGRVDPRREPEADGRRVDGCRVDACRAHQRLEAGTVRARERPQPAGGESAVLVDERDDVGDGRERDEVEHPRERGMIVAEQRPREGVDDPRPTEVGARVVGRTRRDDEAVRQRVARPMVVRDDDVEAELASARDLRDGGDAAVDGDDEVDPVGRELLDRLERKAVALVEPARQAPVDRRAELPQDEDADGGRGDPVDVVVAVHADALSRGDRGADPLDGGGHVAERQRVVTGVVCLEERARLDGVVEAAPDEHGGRRLAYSQLSGERLDPRPVARSGDPAAILHRPRSTVGRHRVAMAVAPRTRTGVRDARGAAAARP